MKKLSNFFILSAIILFTFSCSDSNNQIEEENIVEKVMKSKEELNKGVVQKIFTLEDFKTYARNKNSVVSKLSNEARAEFIKSLDFNEKGIISTAKYTIVEMELTESENESFWLLLGMSKQAYTDYKEYKCVSPHNCQKLEEFICLTGC